MATSASVGADVEAFFAAAKAEVEAAESKVEAAESKVGAAESKLEAAESKVEAAKQEVAAAETDQQKTSAEKLLTIAERLRANAVGALETAQKRLDSQVSVLQGLNDVLTQLRLQELQAHQAAGARPTGMSQPSLGQDHSSNGSFVVLA